MRLGSFIACAAVAPLLIAASQPVRLQPSSPWIVDYAENSCRLIRTFGSGKTTTKFALESPAPGQMDMLVVGKPLETFLEQVPARFLPIGGKTFDGLVARSVVNGDPAILWSSVRMLPDSVFDQLEKEGKKLGKDPNTRPPPFDLTQRDYYRTQVREFAAATTELEIDTRRGRSIILEMGSLGEPLAKFEECGRESLKDWGVNPDIEDKIVRPVWAINPSEWLFASDYPRDMVMRGKESEVAVRLSIDAGGKVTKCTSLSHFTEEEFNRITCEDIVKRAKFEPAELADGTKVPSYYARRVIFRIAH
jgi:TonB family protein